MSESTTKLPFERADDKTHAADFIADLVKRGVVFHSHVEGDRCDGQVMIITYTGGF